MKIWVIKIGTAAILNSEGEIETAVLKNLANGIFDIAKKFQRKIVLISSGAVTSGKNFLPQEFLKKISETQIAQIASAIGQPILMRNFQKIFQEWKIPVAQGLLTREDFSDRSKEIKIRRILKKMLDMNILPILNENDFLSPEELDFSDNDQLAVFVAASLNAEKLIILSNISGFLVKDKIIAEISEIEKMKKFIWKKKSTFGRGGMKSKLASAKICQQLGIEMILASSREKNVLQKIANNQKIGTKFLTLKSEKKSGKKVWLVAGAAEYGKIFVDQKLSQKFISQKVGISILLPGVFKIFGDFKASQVVGIFDYLGKKIGRGVVKFSAKEISTKIKKNKNHGEILIHANEIIIF